MAFRWGNFLSIRRCSRVSVSLWLLLLLFIVITQLRRSTRGGVESVALATSYTVAAARSGKSTKTALWPPRVPCLVNTNRVSVIHYIARRRRQPRDELTVQNNSSSSGSCSSPTIGGSSQPLMEEVRDMGSGGGWEEGRAMLLILFLNFSFEKLIFFCLGVNTTASSSSSSSSFPLHNMCNAVRVVIHVILSSCKGRVLTDLFDGIWWTPNWPLCVVRSKHTRMSKVVIISIVEYF